MGMADTKKAKTEENKTKAAAKVPAKGKAEKAGKKKKTEETKLKKSKNKKHKAKKGKGKFPKKTTKEKKEDDALEHLRTLDRKKRFEARNASLGYPSGLPDGYGYKSKLAEARRHKNE